MTIARANRVRCLLSLIVLGAFLGNADCAKGQPDAPAENAFASDWGSHLDHHWVGPEYWAKPIGHWRVREGRAECFSGGRKRAIHLLTHQMSTAAEPFTLSVRLGPSDINENRSGWAGFAIGSHGSIDDYRHACIFGKGMHAGITMEGKLFIGEPSAEGPTLEFGPEGVELRLVGEVENEAYTLTLHARQLGAGDSGETCEVSLASVENEKTRGNVALVCAPLREREGPRCWFSHWTAQGPKFEADESHAWGPILWSMYTVSRGELKMTVQMPPLVGPDDNNSVSLSVWQNERWRDAGESEIDPLSRTATFRVGDWDESIAAPYQVSYSWKKREGETTHLHEGTIRPAPENASDFVIAGFTGNKDYGFPNENIVEGVTHHDPDMLFFSGDQIYESVGGYDSINSTLEPTTLNYLGKWYLLGWAFGDLMRSRQTVCLTDDHDVYQGNIWGHNGRPTARQERGGYEMDPEWVNMVQRTQMSHLPDPYDPEPIEQGITVHFTDLVFGGISFALLEDRKFKTSPVGLVPPTNSNRVDHVRHPAPDFNPEDSDVPGAVLLGDRQLDFLEHWAADWRGCEMKVCLSQTTFAMVATHFGRGTASGRLVADYDANGWPQTGRDKALRELRRGFAFMLCGDTHLPTIVHHGVDEWEDAGIAFCVPSIAAGYPRAWNPPEPGANHQAGEPEYTGEYLDGFGNPMTVLAAANPHVFTNRGTGNLQLLHDKSSGYGIVRLDREAREITMECWPLFSDPADDAQQFNGWPRTVGQLDNYDRTVAGYLPQLNIRGLENTVVQILRENPSGESTESKDVEYTLRIQGSEFRPMVFHEGPHTIRVGDPERDLWQVFENIDPAEDSSAALEVNF